MKFLTTVNWWLSTEINGSNKPLSRHEDALAEKALEIITAAMSEGMTSGELIDQVRLTDEDGEEGITYHGYWSFEAYNPLGSASNPVIAVVKEDKDNGGFDMSISNVDRCEVILIEDDLCGEESAQEIEGKTVLGWATSCEKDVTRTKMYSDSF